MEKSNGIKRSETWNNIYEVLARLDLKETTGDCMDRPSAATELEELFLKLLPIQNVSNMFVADDVLGFAEHCRLTGKQCTYEELDNWKQ